MIVDDCGVIINGKHTARDYHLEWLAPFEIEAPGAERCRIEVPFADGTLDLTSFLTGNDVKYKNRNLKFNFSCDGDYTKWDIMSDRIENDLHGQLCSIILDTRPDFVYYGVVTVNTSKETLGASCDIMISVDADPYKYERYSSLEPWVWDTFCFEDGIIRNYKDLKVDGTMMLMIPGRRKKIAPVFNCSEPMTVEYGGTEYSLPSGKSKILDIQIGQGEHFLTFSGTGTVSVDYRGGSL